MSGKTRRKAAHSENGEIRMTSSQKNEEEKL